MIPHRAFVVTLTLISAVSIGLVACSSNSPSGAGGPAVTLVTGKLTARQAGRLDREISAPTVAGEAVVVANAVRAEFIRKGRTLLPAGARIRIEPATFRETNAGTATVTSVLTGPDSGRWLLLLVREQGQWLLIGTRRL